MDPCQTCIFFLLVGNVWVLNVLKCGNIYLIGVEKCPNEANSKQESQNNTKDSQINAQVPNDNAQGSQDNAQKSPNNAQEKYDNAQDSDEGGLDKNIKAIVCTIVLIVLIGIGSVFAYRKRHICLKGGRLKCGTCLSHGENNETHVLNESQVPCMANTLQV